MEVTAYSLASRFLKAGIAEMEGSLDHPLILWWLMLTGYGPILHDEVPWCAAFVNGVAWELDLPRPRVGAAAARAWLPIGLEVTLDQAQTAFDVVIIKRGPGNQPGVEVIDAPAHIGFFAGLRDGGRVALLGGNQMDCVSIEDFSVSRVLSVRRLLWRD